MPAPKHKPKAIHKPTLSVALPIIIPASATDNVGLWIALGYV